MNNSLAALRRKRAMLDAEAGSWLEARAVLDDIAARLRARDDASARYELGLTLLDRATVSDFTNRWAEALQDLVECEHLAKGLAPVPRDGLLASVYAHQVELYSRPGTSVNDVARARLVLGGLRATGITAWWLDKVVADLAYRERDWPAAEAGYRALAHRLAEEGWKRGTAGFRICIGRCLIELGRFAEAGVELDQALELLERTGAPQRLAAAQLLKARVLAALGEADRAWQLALASLATQEAMIRRFRAVFDQQRFILDKAEYYQHAFDIALSRSGAEGLWRAWAVAERAKSAYLCQLLANADIPLLEGVDAADVARLRELEAELDRADTTFSLLTASKADASRLATQEQQVDALSRAKLELQERMMRSHPRWAALRAPAAFDLAAEFAKLSSGWLPVSYFWRPQPAGAALHVFWLGTNGEPCHEREIWSEADLARLDAATARLRGKVLPGKLLDRDLAARLLPVRLRAELNSQRRLLISPHDRVKRLPVHALQFDAADRLIARCAVQYLPSFALLPLRRAQGTGQGVLLLGAVENSHCDRRLSDVPRQLTELERIWAGPGGRQVVRRELFADTSLDATGVPLSSWRSFEILHLICHGAFPEQRPFDAALRLGADTLRASELFAEPPSARLVILSACSLGRQANRHADLALVGDEWIGIYLPLFYGGVGCVTVSLWDANADMAAVVMKRLHEALRAGCDPAVALQRALVAVQMKPDALWANWCVVGFPD